MYDSNKVLYEECLNEVILDLKSTTKQRTRLLYLLILNVCIIDALVFYYFSWVVSIAILFTSLLYLGSKYLDHLNFRLLHSTLKEGVLSGELDRIERERREIMDRERRLNEN